MEVVVDLITLALAQSRTPTGASEVVLAVDEASSRRGFAENGRALGEE
jgi:hypothetical protein